MQSYQAFETFPVKNIYFRPKSNQHAKVHSFCNTVQIIKLSTQKLQNYSIMVSCAISVLHECMCVMITFFGRIPLQILRTEEGNLLFFVLVVLCVILYRFSCSLFRIFSECRLTSSGIFLTSFVILRHKFLIYFHEKFCKLRQCCKPPLQ